MTHELESVGAASLGGVSRDTTGDGYINGPCPNCSAEIAGLFCSNCGQSARDLKKPFISLFRDMMVDVLSLDGRLWRTLPALIFLPGKVTRAYIDGKRMRYVPPFRLFLIASILFFLVLFGITERQGWVQGEDWSINGLETAQALIVGDQPLSEYEGFEDVFKEDGKLNRPAAETFLDQLIVNGVVEAGEPERAQLLDRIERLSGETLSRAELFAVLQKWVPRLSFLLVPFYVLTFSLQHFWIRRIYIFDHMIVALHMQSFFYLAATAGMLLSRVHPGIVWGVFSLSTLVYPFLLMGRAYGTNWFFNLFRLFGLLIATITALGLLIGLIVIVSASDLGLVNWSDLVEGTPFKAFGREGDAGISSAEPPSLPAVD